MSGDKPQRRSASRARLRRWRLDCVVERGHDHADPPTGPGLGHQFFVRPGARRSLGERHIPYTDDLSQLCLI